MSAQARQVSPLDRPVEDRLVVVIEVAGGPITRRDIYSRVDDDFESEEELARVLGRLVADGRLVRGQRPRVGRDAEIVYSVPTGARPEPEPELHTSANPQPDAAPPEEPSMSGTRALIVDYFAKNPAWITRKAVAVAIGRDPSLVGPVLRDLVASHELQSRGTGRGLRYAAIGYKGEDTAPAREEEKPRKTREARSAPEPNPPRLPVPAPEPEKTAERIAWAIDDDGTVAINDGTATIRLTPADIVYGVQFLEDTQRRWRRAS